MSIWQDFSTDCRWSLQMVISWVILIWHGACARYGYFPLPSGLTQAAPSLWTHLSVFHRDVEEFSRIGWRGWKRLWQLFLTLFCSVADASPWSGFCCCPQPSVIGACICSRHHLMPFLCTMKWLVFFLIVMPLSCLKPWDGERMWLLYWLF